MQGKTHAVVGVASTLLLSSNPAWYLDCCWGAIGALMPDTDVNGSIGSKATKKVLIGSGIALGVLAVASYFGNQEGVGLEMLKGGQGVGALILLLLSIFGSTQPHRGIMHSLPMMALASVGVYMVNPIYVQPFVIGYASHLVLDLLNYKGEQLLFPLKKRFSFGLCKSDGIVNKALFVCGILACAVLAFSKVTGFVL